MDAKNVDLVDEDLMGYVDTSEDFGENTSKYTVTSDKAGLILMADEEFDCLPEDEDSEKSHIFTKDGVLPIADEDLSDIDLNRAEESYRETEFDEKIKPIVKEKVNEAVQTTTRLATDKLKVEVSEVLRENVDMRMRSLDELRREDAERAAEREKRRRRKELKENIYRGIKLALIAAILVVFICNNQIRERLSILGASFVTFCTNIVNDEKTSSNEVVNDTLETLGTSLNEVNSTYVLVDEEGNPIKDNEVAEKLAEDDEQPVNNSSTNNEPIETGVE